MTAVPDLVAKVQALSEENIARVASLVDELIDQQAREDAADLAIAKAALADGEALVPWEEAKARLDALHGIDQTKG